ncbi:MAG: cephalosporin hydroxylase, partial [Cyanobacteria bacterium HKST-UBA06]|nr:cephalosporin hydroxylase [Cyanobacteria bacterium HKST-UBA06]
RVISIDVTSQVEKAKTLPIAKQMVTYLTGKSTDPAIVQKIKAAAEGKRVLVLLDSDHSMHNVLAELETYAPMVARGSYMIVQDTNVNGHPVLPQYGPGPMEAVEAFLETHLEFEPDRSRERMLFTVCPKGYLKRV